MAGMADLTLDELRLALAPEIARAAVFDGWTDKAVRHAAEVAGADPDVALLAWPGGAMDMIEGWAAAIDAAMERDIAPDALATVPIRERIRRLVQYRLDATGTEKEALRRALAIMAMPQNAARAARLGWRSADAMWRLAGDTATDYNHYTKRAILGSIYAATIAVFVGDESEGKVDTRAFLDRRIEGVMKFEKAKAQLLDPNREGFSVTRFLGRLRYPAR